MFNFCSKKDEEIVQLKKRISELESEKNSEDLLLDELNEVVLKFEKGFFGITVQNTSLNQKLNSIKDNFNKALINNARLADAGIKTLIEYGNAKFDYKLEADNLSGKVGSIILGIEALGGTISEILSLLDTSSQELHEQVVELSSAANNLAVASNQQAASLEETAAALEEVSSTIANTNENTIKMAQLSNEVNVSAQSGQKLANDTADSMVKINEEVTLIQNATAIIDQIAFQTNILSLNAAVEAATAGEAGKGFAVVAAEVRNLASRSAEAAKEINTIVQKAKTRAAEGREIATSMISGYEILNKNISNQITIIQEVSSASKEQRAAIEQINNAVNELDKTTQQNAAAATQISSQTNEIESLSMKLIDVVNHTSYSKDAATRVCDIDMMFVINRLKLDHINFKDINCNKLDSKKSWTVTNENECNLGKWIVEQERSNKAFTKTKNWEYLKEQHYKVHSGVQTAVNANASGDLNTMRNISTEIDKAINGVFQGMQKTKEENCSL